jgi:hypothetical protein
VQPSEQLGGGLAAAVGVLAAEPRQLLFGEAGGGLLVG